MRLMRFIRLGESRDLTILLYAYGSEPGDIHWDPITDISTENSSLLLEPDQLISFADMVILAALYGYCDSQPIPEPINISEQLIPHFLNY